MKKMKNFILKDMHILQKLLSNFICNKKHINICVYNKKQILLHFVGANETIVRN